MHEVGSLECDCGRSNQHQSVKPAFAPRLGVISGRDGVERTWRKYKLIRSVLIDSSSKAQSWISQTRAAKDILAHAVQIMHIRFIFMPHIHAQEP